MSIGLLKDIIEHKPANARLLGLDIGKKTVGLAVSDAGQSIATPLKTIKRTKFAKDMDELAIVIRDYEINGFVLGWPVNMDGSISQSCDVVRSFADEMKNYPAIVGQDPWIALWDERLSTVSVEGLVDELVDKRKTKINSKSSGLIDKLAAQVILQGALEFIRSHS